MIQQTVASAAWRYIRFRLLLVAIWLPLLVSLWILDYEQFVQFPVFPCLFPLSLMMFFYPIFVMTQDIREAQDLAKTGTTIFVEKFGNFDDDDLYRQTKDELGIPYVVVDPIRMRGKFGEETGRLFITGSSIVMLSKNQLWIIRFIDVIWIYTHSYVASNASGTVLYIVLRYGNRVQVNGRYRDKQIDAALEFISTHFPWIIIGDNDETRANWIHDRQSLIDKLDKQREQAFLAKTGN